MAAATPPSQPSLSWRIGSSVVMGVTGALSRSFIFGANTAEVHGLDNFLELLDQRADVRNRKRGLITVSNHISVLDDPLIWGSLPFRYHFNPDNHRWSLGSYDICFKNKILSTFFTLGQVLPTHRAAYSEFGGLFQPTLREAVRLLSRPSLDVSTKSHTSPSSAHLSLLSPDPEDPFSTPSHIYTYSTNGIDKFPAPAAYGSRKYSWIHIFPEGMIHQQARRTMRYFKWGVARLILEPDACPDIIPMWIEGNDHIMHESRTWPRFIPRVNKHCGIWFGDNIGGEGNTIFHELRRKWQKLVDDHKSNGAKELKLGVLSSELQYGPEAVQLREECTRQIRGEILKLRRRRGLPDEDPKEGLMETWREEGGKREGKMEDGSWVKVT